MKKSLPVILSTAMAVSMFASVASADTAATTTAAPAVKTSADFKDLANIDATLKAKIDALLAKGYFEGVSADTFGIDENMTRAQFAKIATLVFGIQVDTSVKTSSFTDVTADDAANGWAIPYIEAAKKAGLIDGVTDTTFVPGDNVTVGQFDTVLLKGLKKTVNVSGTPWYADAVKQAVELKIHGADKDGAAFASRTDLVVGAFAGVEAFAELNKPATVSVSEAKATGVYQVTVSFNKEVDTTKAKLALTKGTLAVASTTTWSDDKKTATLKTDTKINEGDYTVTLSGLDAAEVGTTTASFKATDETVTKIDFVNATDSVAYSANASFKLKAVNQYGEAVSLGTSSFTALVSGQAPSSFKKDADGNLVITADVKGTAGITQGNGIIPVTVYLNDSNVTVSKNFKVGTVPILSKIEASKVTYSNKGTKLVAADETASIALKLFDQYGNEIVKGQFSGGTPEINASNVNPVITPYETNLVVVKAGTTFAAGDLFDDNDNPRIKVKLAAKLDKTADFTVNIYGGSSSATATVSVGAANLATKVEFDTSKVVIASGDNNVFVPIIATDANGNKLSAQDIVDNTSRFNFTVTNGTASVQQTGEDKGKVKLNFTTTNNVGSKVYVSGQINQSQTNTFVQATIPVSDVRVPERITVKTVPAEKAILGASDKVEYQLKDQYDEDISDIAATISSANGQTSQYRVKVTVKTEGTGVAFASKAVAATGGATVPTAAITATEATYTFAYNQLAYFNKGFDITTTAGQEGKVTIKAVVEKAPNGTSNFSEYSSAVSQTLEAIKSDTKLTYSIETIGDLYAAQDKLSSAVATIDGGVVAGSSQFDKKLKVVAKDSAGNKVKLPLNFVKEISSSDSNVVATAPVTTGGVQDGYVLGNKAGTATVSAIVYTNKGETVNLTQNVTVKADSISVDKFEAGKKNRAYDATVAFAYDYFTKDADNQLKVTDQYGIEYKNADIAKYDAVLGIRYTVSVVSGTGTVTVDAKTGAITSVPSTVNEFLITAIAPNGKSVSVLVSK